MGLSSGTLGWVAVAYLLSISAWSPTEDRGPCLSARRPMRHENLAIDNGVLFTHNLGCLISYKWVACNGLEVPLTPGIFSTVPTRSP